MPALSRRREIALLVAAAVVVLLVVAAVLIFGLARPPALEPVAAGSEPQPPAAVAWSGWDGRRECIHVIRPDGSARQLTCDLEGYGLLAWTDQGLIAETWSRAGQQLVVLDPATGEVVERRMVPREAEQQREPADGRPAAALWSERRGGTLFVWTADGQTLLWEVEAPEGYQVPTGVASPDDTVIAATDTAGRLLLFPADGSAPPRLWSDDAARWATLVWEGTPLPPSLRPS